jgi:hypothetical protein
MLLVADKTIKGKYYWHIKDIINNGILKHIYNVGEAKVTKLTTLI